MTFKAGVSQDNWVLGIFLSNFPEDFIDCFVFNTLCSKPKQLKSVL